MIKNLTRLGVFGFLFLYATGGFAACVTDVSGNINGDTWTLGSSPYCVIDNIVVQNLTIESGVRVEFVGNYKFDVIGTLHAVGTEDYPILFRREANNNDGWQGVVLDNVPPGSSLIHVRIEGSKNSGLRILNSFPTLEHVAIFNNESSRGGGIYIELLASAKTLTLSNCNISDNLARGHGGGIYANIAVGSLKLSDCRIADNQASQGSTNSHNYGGGIYFESAAGGVEIVDSEVSGNLSYSYCYDFFGCGTSNRGGGIYIYNGTLALKNSRLESNTASAWANDWDGSYGGGIYLTSGDITLTNTIVAYNTADSSDGNEYGAGIYTDDGNVTSIHSDILYNIPTGIHNGDGLVTAINSILYFNQGDEIAGAATVNYSDVEGGWSSGDGNIDIDPLFVAPTDFHLREDSLCIDAGNADIGGLPATDYDGNPRLIGSSVDMGAYENQSSSTFNISPTSGEYVTTQGFDLVLIVKTPDLSVESINATLDGNDVSGALSACVRPGTLISGGQTFRCSINAGVHLKEGNHVLNVMLDLSDDSTVSDTVTWDVLGNVE